MWGGIWFAGLTYAGYDFDEADIGLFDASPALDACFDQAVGYAGAWYGGTVYAGTPICLEFLDLIGVPTVRSNVQNLCIVRC